MSILVCTFVQLSGHDARYPYDRKVQQVMQLATHDRWDPYGESIGYHHQMYVHATEGRWPEVARIKNRLLLFPVVSKPPLTQQPMVSTLSHLQLACRAQLPFTTVTSHVVPRLWFTRMGLKQLPSPLYAHPHASAPRYARRGH